MPEDPDSTNPPRPLVRRPAEDEHHRTAPIGLAAHPPEDPNVVAHTVASWAKARFGDLPTAPDVERPGIVHRLDKGTSGLLMVARTPRAYASLVAQLAARTVERLEEVAKSATDLGRRAVTVGTDITDE